MDLQLKCNKFIMSSYYNNLRVNVFCKFVFIATFVNKENKKERIVSGLELVICNNIKWVL